MAYANSREHLLAELERIRAILEGYGAAREAQAAAESVAAPPTEEGVDLAVEPSKLSLALPEDVREDVADRTDAIETACAESGSDVSLRLRTVAERFDLSRAHLDVLLLALAPDVDAAYEDVFRGLHEDSGVTRPTIELVADLFAATDEQRLAATALVGPASPLRQHDLVGLTDPVGASNSSKRRPLVVEGRLRSYLQGHRDLDPVLEPVATLASPDGSIEDQYLDDAVADRLKAIDVDDGDPGTYYFSGPEGSEAERAVGSLSTGTVLRSDLAAVRSEGLLGRLRREALLQDCPLHLQAGSLQRGGSRGDGGTSGQENGGTGPDGERYLAVTLQAVGDLPVDVFVTGVDPWQPDGSRAVELDAIVEFSRPSPALRRAFWADHAEELPEDVDPAVLAGTFTLTHGELEAALSTARSLAGTDPMTPEDVYRGCRAQSADELGKLAQHIEPSFDWDDIELPAETRTELEVVRDHVKHRTRIYDDWGFAEQFSRGTGVVALFEGPSGTGKTMAAEVIADDVGMDLYKIDLSSVVSKYIGETEENLEAIFEAAEHSNAVLLFDEADAVFGDRAEVSDATDRYANVEVNYLLQRIETYDGVVLMTTNYDENIDSAFERRIDHTVSFDRPREATRDEIWRGILPDDAPTGDVDEDFLAQFEFTGGQIKSVVQTAAVLAAGDGVDAIEMSHVVRGVRRELSETGTMYGAADFGEYGDLLRDTSNGETIDGDDGPSGSTAGGAPDRDPEHVVREFVVLLGDGQESAAADLCRPRTDDVLSPRIREAVRTAGPSIAADLERTEETSDAVTLEFEDGAEAFRFELRSVDGEWRIVEAEHRRVDAGDVGG